MQVRYQAALRPDESTIIARSTVVAQESTDFLELLPNFDRIRRILVAPAEARAAFEIDRRVIAVAHHQPVGVGPGGHRRGNVGLEAMAGAVDRKSLLVKEVADAADQQHLVVLVIPTVAAALDRLQLRELLLPITEHVRLDRTEVTYLADGEIPLGGDGWQLGFSSAVIRHGSQLRPWPSAFDSRET